MPNARRIDITAIGIELDKVLSSRCEFLLEPIYADSLSPFASRGAEETRLTDDDLWDLPHGQNLRTAEERKNHKIQYRPFRCSPFIPACLRQILEN